MRGAALASGMIICLHGNKATASRIFFNYNQKHITMNSKIYFSLFLVFFFLFGCGKDENSEESNETNKKTTAVFNPNLTYGTVTDQEGNIYKTIKIGTQTWMAENLRTTKYRNGDLIATTTPSTKDISQENQPKYQWTFDFNVGENNVFTYGRMYTWNAIIDSRNITPTGWHIASEEEWNQLIEFLGNDSEIGLKLKEVGNVHWANPNNNATNESGFTALPGGTRYKDGTFYPLGNLARWWCGQRYLEDRTSAHIFQLSTENNWGGIYDSFINEGCYVRCVKDN